MRAMPEWHAARQAPDPYATEALDPHPASP